MPITLDRLADDETIEVIASIDDSLDCSEEEYDQYLESLDEDDLSFKNGMEPTRWVMTKILPYKVQKAIDNSRISMRQDGKKDPTINLNVSFRDETVRHALVGIKYPDSVPEDQRIKLKIFNGRVDEKLMAKLNAAGITADLFMAHQNALRSGATIKKK